MRKGEIGRERERERERERKKGTSESDTGYPSDCTHATCMHARVHTHSYIQDAPEHLSAIQCWHIFKRRPANSLYPIIYSPWWHLHSIISDLCPRERRTALSKLITKGNSLKIRRDSDEGFDDEEPAPFTETDVSGFP